MPLISGCLTSCPGVGHLSTCTDGGRSIKVLVSILEATDAFDGYGLHPNAGITSVPAVRFAREGSGNLEFGVTLLEIGWGLKISQFALPCVLWPIQNHAETLMRCTLLGLRASVSMRCIRHGSTSAQCHNCARILFYSRTPRSQSQPCCNT